MTPWSLGTAVTPDILKILNSFFKIYSSCSSYTSLNFPTKVCNLLNPFTINYVTKSNFQY